MARFLQILLDTQEPIFSNGMAKLEKTTSGSGVDVRLIADIIEKAHFVMRRLGLDVADTTGRELYLALNEIVKRGDEDLLFDVDYVLLSIDDTTISFNLIDVVENAHHELPYGRQITDHGKRSLRGEIIKRYLDHTQTDEVTTYEIADLMGLLPEQDACYNDCKYSKKQTSNHQKEPKE